MGSERGGRGASMAVPEDGLSPHTGLLLLVHLNRGYADTVHPVSGGVKSSTILRWGHCKNGHDWSVAPIRQGLQYHSRRSPSACCGRTVAN